MKTFSIMSTPILVITSEAYDLLWEKLTRRQRELEKYPSSVLTNEIIQEKQEIKEKLDLLGPLLLELAPLIF